ncbi:MAG: response regulator transcription factor [Actinomycetia bacterium]|nr:response regulator transcription factor [Actinomycetes bacterium]
MDLLLITPRPGPDPLPEISLLPHQVTIRSAGDQVLTESAASDAVVVDARDDLVAAHATCQLFTSAQISVPRLVVLPPGGLSVITADWGCADFVLDGAGPAEYDARLRLATSSLTGVETISSGGIVIDEGAYTVTLHGRLLDLTYTEFELLKYLVQHPGRVFSREHLLAEVWGSSYYGGTRTVDVHVRRLRAKLTPEYESLICTVRNVGYRFSERR